MSINTRKVRDLQKYHCDLLVFYELHDSMIAAIGREKQIKGGSRRRKLELVEDRNPNWNDLYEEIIK